MIKKALLIIAVFLLGVLVSNIASHYASAEKELTLPEDNAQGGYEFSTGDYLSQILAGNSEPKTVAYPKDRIDEDKILVSNDRVLINLEGAEWASFTDTHSMEPVLFAGANAIETTPQSEDDVQVGDIVAYVSEYADGVIIHRVVYKGSDEKGTYFVLKGDNNEASDPGRIRFSQIRRVVVAIIY